MNDFVQILKTRGLYAQAIHEEELGEHLKAPRTAYAGFDPTADSLHVGHLLPALNLRRWQQAGHRAIVLVGGGTGYIGDPTGKSEMRQMITVEGINHNIECQKRQLSKIVDLNNPEKGVLLNNADWLKPLNYLEFLRDFGPHFNVNKMLQAECYKQRMEDGLTFLEFNYMLLQSYDFFHLNEKYNCSVQLGGDDQWSNMLGGVALVRKLKQAKAFCITSPLLLTSDGRKMGKTEKGAIWLDPDKTTPYDFYQYWRNTPDADVKNCLMYLTDVPVEKIAEMTKVMDKEINLAKELLAKELTTLIHGSEEADKAETAAKSLFVSHSGGAEAPEAPIAKSILEGAPDVATALFEAGLCESKSEIRRLIQQGGLSLNGIKITDIAHKLTLQDVQSVDSYVVKMGKKKFYKLVIS